MKVCRMVLSLWAVFSCFVNPAIAQQSPARPSSTLVPRLVNFSGRVRDAQGKAVPGVSGVTFAIYKEQDDGAPLWLETQNVQADARGNYTVQLGASSSAGLPLDLFNSGEARWLGVRVSGQEEQPRILLLSVPYALKAADADTIGGLPASAFLLATPGNAGPAAGASGSPATGSNQPNVGGSGTQNFIPLWTDGNGDLGNSTLFQLGSGNSSQIGINTATPAATLDVNGGAITRGPLQLPSTGTANASQGFASQPFLLQGSAFNSNTQNPIAPTFQLQTEPSGNNSSSPAGTLNLLYGSGSGAPGETGLNIASNGQITFAKGQTFPGAGTITGVTAGTGLSGGGTSGKVTLSINVGFANQNYAQLKAANTFTANQTVNANVTARQFISTVAQGTAPLQVTSTTQVTNLNASLLDGLSASAFQPAGSYASLGSNTFTGDQNVTGNVNATGTVNATNGFNLGGTPFAFGSFSNSNAFLGFGGNSSTTGQGNTAIGTVALQANTTGANNSASGLNSLFSNTTGNNNTAGGTGTLLTNTSGSSNTAVGASALSNNITGNSNTAIGAGAGPDVNSTNLTNATAIGANAVVSESNALVLGGTGANAVNVGIGTATPAATLDVHGTGNFTGLITFAPGQSFPGTGTITGVTAGTDLLGGGSNGNVTLNVDTTKLVTGVTAGTDLTGGGTGGNVTLNLDTAKVPQLGGGNVFNGNQTINGNVSALNLSVPQSTDSSAGVILLGSSLIHTCCVNQGGNVFIGFNTGNFTTTGVGDIGIGQFALGSNSSGQGNTAIGDFAMESNTTGGSNTVLGRLGLSTNDAGSFNTSIGLEALRLNTSGGSNTALGFDALRSNTTGGSNTGIGVAAGFTTNGGGITGSNNTFLGASTNPGTQTGINNATAIGANAQVTASNAMVLGSINGVNGATADALVGIGTTAPTAKLDVRGNANFSGLISFAPGQTFPGTGTITGVSAGTDLLGGGSSGNVTLNVDTSKVVTAVTAGTDLIGGGAGGIVTLNLDTTKVPQLATANTFATTQTISSGDLALKNGNLDLPSTGVVNFSGSALLSSSTTSGSVSLGIGAANPNSGADNVAVGFDALFRSPTGQLNTAIGAFALEQDTTGHDNMAGGGGALQSNTSGCCNSALGSGALESNTSGSNNTAEGDGALQPNTTGNNNTALGSSAGVTTNFGSITGSNNTFVGSLSNPGTQTAITNASAIGANAQVTASNSMVLGSIKGVNGAVASTNVGIGTTAPVVTLDVAAASGSAHDPVAQFGSTGTTDSDALKLYNGSGLTEVFISGGTNNFVPGSAVGDGGLRVNAGKKILLGDSSAARLTIDASGNVTIKGNLSKGGGSFKIDHPLDPLNKYLYHSFVESPDMMNVYNGNVVTDRRGVATIVLPDYFEALNRDFRYQLTVIGQFAQAIVAKEIVHNRFIIKTSKPSVKVSWQVTGIRQDAFANLHRIPVVEEKPKEARGTYLHPEAFAAEKTGATIAKLGNRQDH